MSSDAIRQSLVLIKRMSSHPNIYDINLALWMFYIHFIGANQLLGAKTGGPYDRSGRYISDPVAIIYSILSAFITQFLVRPVLEMVLIYGIDRFVYFGVASIAAYILSMLILFTSYRKR